MLSPTNTSSDAHASIPPPQASEQLERKKIALGLETKRLISEIEKEVADLDWSLQDPLHSVPHLIAPAQHLLAAGGKRVRPLLVCILARSLHVPFQQLAACAVAAELVHTATLLHDDILDGASTRRGRITAHLKYDAHTTILSGDALLAKAIVDMAELGDPEILKRLALTVRELVEGECLQADMQAKVHGEVETLLEVARRKTASLFAWCAWVAGHRAGKHSNTLFQFGQHLGLAFQLLDDILDWEGENTGKSTFQDLAEKKLNILGAVLVQKSPEAEKMIQACFESFSEHHTQALEIATNLGNSLKQLPAYKEAIQWTRQTAEKHSALALACLQELPDSPWRSLATQLTQKLLKRYH